MATRKKVVVLTGAGISAESGIATFRDSNGLWEGHDVMDVASPEGWHRNPELVLNFYNERRKTRTRFNLIRGIWLWRISEQKFDVTIITQNVDDLHERAGSTNVIHLHGKLFESRSTADENLIYPISGWELKKGDLCEKGSQLRPNIVWFGEMVPLMEVAVAEARKADIFMVVGTSLVVYPAAGLIDYVPRGIPVYVIDPNLPPVAKRSNLYLIAEKASTGVPKIAIQLEQEAAAEN